jgi:hypothetical protein
VGAKLGVEQLGANHCDDAESDRVNSPYMLLLSVEYDPSEGNSEYLVLCRNWPADADHMM